MIGDVRGGHGLMLGIELVSDRASKTPIDTATIARIQRATYEAGTMVRMSGSNFLLSPPLVLTGEDVTVILDSLETGFSAA